jgi:hypothetical protein
VLSLPLPTACPELCNKTPFSSFTMPLFGIFWWRVGPGIWNLRSLGLRSKIPVSVQYSTVPAERPWVTHNLQATSLQPLEQSGYKSATEVPKLGSMVGTGLLGLCHPKPGGDQLRSEATVLGLKCTPSFHRRHLLLGWSVARDAQS